MIEVGFIENDKKVSFTKSNNRNGYDSFEIVSKQDGVYFHNIHLAKNIQDPHKLYLDLIDVPKESPLRTNESC